MDHHVLVLQHAEWQPPGELLLRACEENRIDLHVTRIWQESASDFADFDGLIILGGPFCIDQDVHYPFLREEKRLFQAWIHLNKPCLGFNLGHHLIAKTSGASVGPDHWHSTGFIDGLLTHEGKQHPLFKNLSSPLPLFKWHRQAIRSPLPRNMVSLATSKDCMVEACCLEGQPHIIGLQCDNYAAAPDDVKLLTEHNREMLTAGCTQGISAQKIVASARVLAGQTSEFFAQLIKNFVDILKK